VYRSAATEKRAYFSFDTSIIPDDATILKVEFYQKLSDAQPVGTPQIFGLGYDIGQIIGSSLDGTLAEWSGLTTSARVTERETATNGAWIDLAEVGEDPTPWVSKTGTTDIRIIDTSTQGDGDDTWGTDFNGAKPSEQCLLRVTYSAAATDSVIADSIVTTLQARTGDGQALDGIESVAHDPGSDVGMMPSIQVHVESFEQLPVTEIMDYHSRWFGRYTVRVRVQVSQFGAWWRSLVEYLAAVRSILGDESARAITGVMTMLPAGGDPPRDGVGVLRFHADVYGSYEEI